MISPYQWDLDELSRTALRLYRPRRRDYFLKSEFVRCLSGVTTELKETEAWEAIAKCPFVIRREDRLRFSHHTFFDYFVAKGMQLESKSAKAAELNAFDEIVLDNDIRRFLRMLEGDDWYPRTQFSYALHESQLAEWDPECGLVRPNRALLKELEIERCTLLDMMTEPEQFKPEDAAPLITKFLDRQLRHLHPRCLMYNLEGVAVYTKAFHWDASMQQIDDRLSSILVDLLEYLDRHLPLKTGKSMHAEALQGAYELLINRILYLARHMRYPWHDKYKKWADVNRFEKDIGLTRPDLADERDAILND